MAHAGSLNATMPFEIELRGSVNAIGLRKGACRAPWLARPFDARKFLGAAGEISADLVGSVRVRRHSHHHARSAPPAASPMAPALNGSGSPTHYSAATFSDPNVSISVKA